MSQPEAETAKSATAFFSRSLPSSSAPQLELNRITGGIKRRKWLILAIIASSMLCAALASQLLTPLYRAQSSVVVAVPGAKIMEVAEVLDENSFNNYTVQTESQIIMSRTIAAQVAESLKIAGNEAHLKALDLSKDHLSSVDVTTRDNQIIDALLQRLSVSPASDSRVIHIRFQSSSASFAASAANSFADAYIYESLQYKTHAASTAGSWLSDRLEKQRSKLKESQLKLEGFREESGIIEHGDESLRKEQLIQLNYDLMQAKTTRANIEASVRQAKALLAEGNPESLANVLNSQIIHNLKDKEGAANARIAEMQSQFRDTHPQVRLAIAERDQLRAKIAEEAQHIIASMEHEMELARAKEATIAGNISVMEKQLGMEKEDGATLHALENEVAANTELYNVILSRFNETNVQDDSSYSPDARKISNATVPSQPVSPNIPLLMLLALVFSTAIGVSAALMLEFLMPGFHTSHQLEDSFGLPVLAMLPEIADLKQQDMPHRRLLSISHHPLYSESIRALRTSIIKHNGGKLPNVMMITSSTPDEGKTSTVFSLATISRLLNQRCLLVDCDLRKSALAERLKLDIQAGLGDFLSGKAEIKDILYKDEKTGVYFIPGGRAHEHPLDLLESKRMQQFMEGIRKKFDFVLLDAPPVLSVSDAFTIARFSDFNLYMVRWEFTPRGVIAQGLKMMQEKLKTPLAVALSRVDVKKHSFYHYSDSDYVYFQKYSYVPH